MVGLKLKERGADKEFRESRRISLIEVANETGIGRITLSRMLNRGAHVRSDTLDRPCTFFDCRIEEMVEHMPDSAAEKKKAKKPRVVSRCGRDEPVRAADAREVSTAPGKPRHR
ncbi:MAG: helix-turn-helix transcriptional regulator [Proteobacteria bacterium]|nr:helix-turn-helix transcriptional regulator [Pseudomonadota bacterium]